MYQVSELSHKGGSACYVFNRLFFSIYYRSKDNAFKNAANTWKSDVQSQQAFVSGQDYFYEKEIQSECDFTTAWDEVLTIANNGSYRVWAGQLFTHSSKQGDGNDGLEFISCGGNDGTFKQNEIIALPKLPWHERGFLILAGCNSGLNRSGWSPAQVFAKSQSVTTLGQTGYAYFSTTWNKYVEKTTQTSICLWAFRRGKNGALGSGDRMTGNVFNG